MSESVFIAEGVPEFNAAVNSSLTTGNFSRASRPGDNPGGLLPQMHKYTIALLMKPAATIKGSRP
ncbi:MAG: hypothetical protein U1E81_17085 [Xanthobacteraceae bacterium]